MWRLKYLGMACAAMLALAAWAQSDVLSVKRAAELRQAPSETSSSVASLPALTAVTRLPERQGPWMHVKTQSGQIGWIHMFDVSTAAAQTSTASNASGALRGLANLFGGSNNQGATTATSTVGIRGLGAEDIANAQPNLEGLKRAEGMRADAAQAKRFASESQLAARAVDPLPAPQAPAAQGTSDDAFGSKRGGGK